MTDSAYIAIADKYARHALGAPLSGGTISEAFLDYLRMLYTPEEAELVRHLELQNEYLPSRYDVSMNMTAGQVAGLSGRDIVEVKKTLDGLVRRGAIPGTNEALTGFNMKTAKYLLVFLRTTYLGSGLPGTLKTMWYFLSYTIKDWIKYGPRKAGGLFISLYSLPPVPMLVNHHNFYTDVKPGDIDAARAYQDFFIRDGYYRNYEGSRKGTRTFRAIPVNRAIEHGQRVMGQEEAHAIIDASGFVTLVSCPCRTRTEKLGIRECKDRNPIGTCIMPGFTGLYFHSLGLGKEVTKEQARQYLDEMQDLGLVAITENHTNPAHAIICLCCECCCSQVRGRTRWDNLTAIAPSNFVPSPDENCVHCGKCAKRCFFGAITVDEKGKGWAIDEAKCLGCGVCTITCKKSALTLKRVDRAESFSSAGALFERIAAENR